MTTRMIILNKTHFLKHTSLLYDSERTQDRMNMFWTSTLYLMRYWVSRSENPISLQELNDRIVGQLLSQISKMPFKTHFYHDGCSRPLLYALKIFSHVIIG